MFGVSENQKRQEGTLKKKIEMILELQMKDAD